MAFHDREYLIYAVLGHPLSRPPWVETTWTRIFEALDPLTATARGAASVRSSQLGRRPDSPHYQSISFGRIGWNQQGCRKWIHREDGELLSGGHALFEGTEIWAPSWTVCEREGLAPDFFFGMIGEAQFSSGARAFNSICVTAIASDLEKADAARTSAVAVASIVDAVLRVRCVRPWGLPTLGGNAFTNPISSLASSGLFKHGARQQLPVSLANLAGTWEAF